MRFWTVLFGWFWPVILAAGLEPPLAQVRLAHGGQFLGAVVRAGPETLVLAPAGYGGDAEITLERAEVAAFTAPGATTLAEALAPGAGAARAEVWTAWTGLEAWLGPDQFALALAAVEADLAEGLADQERLARLAANPLARRETERWPLLVARTALALGRPDEALEALAAYSPERRAAPAVAALEAQARLTQGDAEGALRTALRGLLLPGLAAPGDRQPCLRAALAAAAALGDEALAARLTAEAASAGLTAGPPGPQP